MNKQEILDQICQKIPDYCALAPPKALSGGYLNFVWRVGIAPQSVVVKYTPSFIASAPEVAFDPKRLHFEATALTSIQAEAFFSLPDDIIRPPKVMAYLPDEQILIMEDLGSVPHVGTWIGLPDTQPADIQKALGALGNFFGLLHTQTLDKPYIAEQFQNEGVQQVRQTVQYQTGQLAQQLGLPEADYIGQLVHELGRQMLQPGICLTMGDLWPTSIMVQGSCNLRLIDWEFAHFGWPIQDIAHFAAHLWLYQNRQEKPAIANRYELASNTFLTQYAATVGTQLKDREKSDQYAYHFANEILMRTVGAFQTGYIYEGLTPDHPSMQRAIDTAWAHFIYPHKQTTFSLLPNL